MTDYIDNEVLISLIQERPVLWDKSLNMYKDRTATENAWLEVYRQIRTDFDALEEKEKKYFGKEVMKRWKNLRDAFLKAEKKDKEDQARGLRIVKKRKYIFYDELQFLKKIYVKPETSEICIIEEKNTAENDVCSLPPENTEGEGSVRTRIKEKAVSITQSRRKQNIIDEGDLKISNSPEKAVPEKPQMSFFHSLLPHTEGFDSNEWLQFQMEVLRVISNIKNKKTAAHQTSSSVISLN